jgi:hypothetical protein
MNLFFAAIEAYIESCRRKPTMAINCLRNKPFGPGGGTRRLHQGSVVRDRIARRAAKPTDPWRGRNRIDEGVKVVLSPGMVPPLSGQPYSCQ